MILLCLLSFRRPNYLARTIEAFVRHNETLLGRCLKMIALDQCASQETLGVFEGGRSYFEKVYTTEINLGIGWGFSQLVELSRLHEADFILFLEDDWLCQVPLEKHLVDIEDLFRTRPDVGTLRLRTVDDAVATVNHVTMLPVEKTRWRDSFLIGNYHYVFNPHLVRVGVARSMVPVSGEHHAQIRYQALGFQAVQLADRMFHHIGEHRAPGRISRLPAPEPIIPYGLIDGADGFFVRLPNNGSGQFTVHPGPGARQGGETFSGGA